MQSHTGCICLTFLHCVYSNVFSNRLPVKMQSYIGCICLTFIHSVFSNVSSNCLPEKKHNYTGCTCLTFLQCVFKCILKLTPRPIFLMDSFLVSPQITFRCELKSALNPSRFDVTIKTFFFSMCCLNVECQFRFAPECFVTDITGRLNFCVDSPVVVIQSIFNQELLSTHIADKITIHFSENCSVLVLPGRLADTD